MSRPIILPAGLVLLIRGPSPIETVIPAQAGIQNAVTLGRRILCKQPLDSRLRGNDGSGVGQVQAMARSF